jgi:hypothetical protein
LEALVVVWVQVVWGQVVWAQVAWGRAVWDKGLALMVGDQNSAEYSHRYSTAPRFGELA